MNAVDEAVQRIKAAGFSHIKFELEGDLGRDGDRECYDCNGDGYESCSNCDGEGAVEQEEYVGQNYHTNWVECDDCSGDGNQQCTACDGNGNTGMYMSERDCEDFMVNHVSQEAKDALAFPHMDVRDSDPDAYYNGGHSHMGFYEDGSVDSEFTFTIPIEAWRTAKEWINAFVALGERCDNGEVDVHGAGMHISLLTSGNYPTRTRLDSEGMFNFERQVNRLLPALFFLASAGHQSRGLGYRSPRVSSEDKYSAIFTHGNTCIEYRVFETCYDNPDAIGDYIQVISNTLKYYADPSLQVKQLNKEFYFPDGGSELARFFTTPDQLRILNAQIKELKPVDKTIKKLKQERGVFESIKSLTQKEKTRVAQLRADYAEYRKHYETERTRPLNSSEQRDVDYMMIHEGMTHDQAFNHIRTRYSNPLQTLSEFIAANLRNNYRGTRLTV